jgi:hypothetical protein
MIINQNSTLNTTFLLEKEWYLPLVTFKEHCSIEQGGYDVGKGQLTPL